VGKVVFTNTPVAGAYRGLGAPQGHFALESLVDTAAERLGIDPVEFRLRHHVPPEGQPGEPYVPKDKNVSSQPIEGGIPFSSNYLAECLKEGARRIDWKPRPNGPRKLNINGKYRGTGVAASIYRTGQSNASAVVKINAEGKAELLMSSMDVGQGAWTILTQIAAEALGLRYEDVKGTFADTQITPFAHATSGSTTTFTSGLAAQRAAEDVRRKLLDAAARLLEVGVDALEIRDGIVFERGAQEHHLPVGKVVARIENHELVSQASVRAGSKTHIVNSFAAHFAEVEVDPESGMIRVLRYVAVHDSGRIMNPVTAEGQVEGGVIQALGWTLIEEIPFDPETGAPLAHNLHDFKIPTVVDCPKIEVVLLDHPDPVGPYGAKAIGEPAQVPGAAAIANAVYDATGVRIRHLPITAEKILEGLAERR
jgi:xanthine dehydrogenase molybdenum-binding subunit